MSSIAPTGPDRSQSVDVAVIGAGPVGLAAALALGQAGVATALVARNALYADNRTTALLRPSVDLLRALGVWEQCAPAAAPLRTMRLVDDTGRLLRAPEIAFTCAEIGLEEFGFNIENRILVEAMERRAQDLPTLRRIDADALDIAIGDTSAAIRMTDDGVLSASLVVAADGRRSLCREAAGIAVIRRDLPQSAVTFNVAHARPHRGVSTEFHTAHGPCVIVPLPGERSSAVWVAAPAEAERLAALGDEDLAAALAAQVRHHLGRMRIEGRRHVFPLSFEQPRRLAARRIALIGEAAHVLPPIGAQGLNLGLRDAAAIARIAAEALACADDPGADNALAEYERARRADVWGRGLAIGAVNGLLLADFLPAQFARAMGMQALAAIGPLRRFAMRQALAGGDVSTAPQADRF